MQYIITEIIGAMAYATLALSYYRKKKIEILFTQIIALILFSIHYYLLSGITGTVCNILELIPLAAIYFFDKYNLKNKKIIIACMIPILFLIAIFTFENVFSIFPIMACCFTVSSFLAKKERIIRGIGIVSATCWLIYAFALHSMVTVIFQSLILIFVTIAFIKNEKNIKKM